MLRLEAFGFKVLILVAGLLLSNVPTVHSNDRLDVMSEYTVTNEMQCQRLCWYRPLCSSYSYHLSAHAQGSSNCVLHASTAASSDVTSEAPTLTAGWTETSASSLQITNGCINRPCNNTQVCVPASSVSVPTSPVSVSYACLEIPSDCGAPEPTAHADVIHSGTSQDDVAQVTCDEEYVASPKDVPVEMRCLVTSRWTPFVGACMRYEYKSEGISFQEATLPWKLVENSQLCIKGVFGSTGQLFVSLMPDSTGQNVDAQISFRYEYRGTTEVISNTKENNQWNAQKKIGSMPLVPGDSFNLTLHVQSDRLQYTLNEAHVYNIPLDSVESTVVRIGGDADIVVTYINLISGCD